MPRGGGVSAKKRYKEHARKREAGGFVALPHAVLRSAEFASLSPFALKALMDLLAQHRGDNNGDLCAAWSLMVKRGWRSRDSLSKGVAELLHSGFVVVTRRGVAGGLGKKRIATLYAVTFYEIDWCGGKLDLQAPSRTFIGTWRRAAAPSNVAPLRGRAALSVTRPSCQSGPDHPAHRVNSKVAA